MTEARTAPEDREHETEERNDTTVTERSYDPDLLPDPDGGAGVTTDDWEEGSDMPGPSTGEDGGGQPW